MVDEQERRARVEAAIAVWRADVKANNTAFKKHMATWFGEASVLVAVFPTIDQLLHPPIDYQVAVGSMMAAVVLLAVELVALFRRNYRYQT